MSEIVYLFIIAALFGVVIFILVLQSKERSQWKAERKDLCDRIMAGSVDEYRLIKEPPQKPRVFNPGAMRKREEWETLVALTGKERQEK
jgi:hypothetical protein